LVFFVSEGFAGFRPRKGVFLVVTAKPSNFSMLAKDPTLVIPAKAGIQFLAFFLWAL
jgi:hypothetical protein